MTTTYVQEALLGSPARHDRLGLRNEIPTKQQCVPWSSVGFAVFPQQIQFPYRQTREKHEVGLPSMTVKLSYWWKRRQLKAKTSSGLIP